MTGRLDEETLLAREERIQERELQAELLERAGARRLSGPPEEEDVAMPAAGNTGPSSGPAESAEAQPAPEPRPARCPECGKWYGTRDSRLVIHNDANGQRCLGSSRRVQPGFRALPQVTR